MVIKEIAALFFILLGVTFHSNLASACAVCFSGQGKSLEAYYWITVILSALPVVLFASIYYWIKKNQHHFEEQK